MKFSCIIPAYNEAPRIAKVLKPALECKLLDEIIVIDDGSKDNTWEIIEQFNDPRLVKIQQENTGKTGAVLNAVSHARGGDYIVMLDADLQGLSAEAIEALIIPIKDKKCEVTLSIRKNSLLIYKFLWTDFVTGERVLPISLFENPEYFHGPGYGLEVKLNNRIQESKIPFRSVYWNNIACLQKSKKIPFLKAVFAELRMVWEVISVFGIRKTLGQMWYFSKFSSFSQERDEFPRQ